MLLRPSISGLRRLCENRVPRRGSGLPGRRRSIRASFVRLKTVSLILTPLTPHKSPCQCHHLNVEARDSQANLVAMGAPSPALGAGARDSSVRIGSGGARGHHLALPLPLPPRRDDDGRLGRFAGKMLAEGGAASVRVRSSPTCATSRPHLTGRTSSNLSAWPRKSRLCMRALLLTYSVLRKAGSSTAPARRPQFGPVKRRGARVSKASHGDPSPTKGEKSLLWIKGLALQKVGDNYPPTPPHVTRPFHDGRQSYPRCGPPSLKPTPSIVRAPLHVAQLNLKLTPSPLQRRVGHEWSNSSIAPSSSPCIPRARRPAPSSFPWLLR